MITLPIIGWFVGNNFEKEMINAANNKDLEKLIKDTMIFSETDKEGNIIDFNNKFLEISGYTQEEITGENHRIISSGLHPDEFWNGFYKVQNIGKTWYKKITNKKKDGTLYHIMSANRKRHNGNYVRISTDITDVVQQNKELLEKENINSRTSYMIRHDIRNYTIILKKYLDRLNQKISIERAKELKLSGTLKVINKAFEQFEKVYYGVYDWTLVNEKNKELPKKTYEINTLLRQYLKNTVYSGNVIVEVKGYIKVNEGLFINAIDNLIRNSINYNKSKNKQIRIYKEGVDLIIEDNGIGMSSSDYEKYKMPNIRGKLGEGTGLGLSIASLIIEKHGYELICKDIKKGTKMIIKNIFK
jgi:PAS domain S-box-containing protein